MRDICDVEANLTSGVTGTSGPTEPGEHDCWYLLLHHTVPTRETMLGHYINVWNVTLTSSSECTCGGMIEIRFPIPIMAHSGLSFNPYQIRSGNLALCTKPASGFFTGCNVCIWESQLLIRFLPPSLCLLCKQRWLLPSSGWPRYEQQQLDSIIWF